MSPRTTPAARLRSAWERLQRWPGGSALFSRLLGTLVPYTGTIAPHVVELRPGYAKIRMNDRRAVRNHLRSVHAIAIANLAEVTSGLAMTLTLPDDARGIVTAFSIEYVKKARGTLTAESTVAPIDASIDAEHRIEAVVKDEAGDVVARAVAQWRIGPATRGVERPAPHEAATT
jgi:acyl-coenzyme A thioesterase PaaI-like protein